MMVHRIIAFLYIIHCPPVIKGLLRLSNRAIAGGLNAEGIAGPSGRNWGQSTINGNRKRSGLFPPLGLGIRRICSSCVSPLYGGSRNEWMYWNL